MHHAVAIWNLREEGRSLIRSVGDYAGFGFDTISFLPRDILRLEKTEARGLKELMEKRGLSATIHGNFDLARDDAARLVEFFPGRLKCLTFDAARTETSLGLTFDTARMAGLLTEVAARSHDTDIRFGVEDFPLDGRALEHYRRDLAPFLDHPRFGALMDIGHMNMRLRRGAYFAGLGAAEYLARVPVPIIEVHLHDNGGEGDTHSCFGDGNVNFAEVARGLREIGFDGVSTIEIAPSLHGATPAGDRPRVKEALDTWRELRARTAI